MSLEGLTVAQLLELGGLKRHCSAGLRCVAHGLDLPCSLCELEGESGHGAVCHTCGHHFREGILETTERACQSAAEFASKGKIAFEADALAAWRRSEAERISREEADRAAAKRERQALERQALERQRREEAEQAERARIDRERAEAAEASRLEQQRRERERAEAEAASGAERHQHLGRLTRVAVGIAAIGALAIITPYVRQIDIRAWFPDGQRMASTTPSVAAPASGQLAASAPPVSMVQAQAPKALLGIPAADGYVTDPSRRLTVEDVSYLKARLEKIAAAGVTARLLLIDSTSDEPIEDFGRRVGTTWNDAGAASRSDLLISVASQDRKIRIDTTNAMRLRLTDQDASRLIETGFRPAVQQGLFNGLHALVDQLERTLAGARYGVESEAGLEKATNESLRAIGVAITSWDGKGTSLLPAQKAALDSAIAQLESMPKPSRGDRKTARQLHANGLSLIGQAGFEALAVEKLQLAHAADPLDVQVLNDLAYAEQHAGDHHAAMAHLVKTLRMAPTRTSAWVNLAETAPFAAETREQGVQTAAAMYMVGFWFSKDQPKTLEYLRRKAAPTETSEEVRTAASQVLQYLEKLESVAALLASAPQPKP